MSNNTFLALHVENRPKEAVCKFVLGGHVRPSSYPLSPYFKGERRRRRRIVVKNISTLIRKSRKWPPPPPPPPLFLLSATHMYFFPVMISCLSALSPHIWIRRGLENFRIKESEEKIPQVPGVSHGILPFFSLDPFSFPPKCTGAKKKKKHRKSPVQKTFFNIFTTQYSKVWQIRSCAFFAHGDTPAGPDRLEKFVKESTVSRWHF